MVTSVRKIPSGYIWGTGTDLNQINHEHNSLEEFYTKINFIIAQTRTYFLDKKSFSDTKYLH